MMHTHESFHRTYGTKLRKHISLRYYLYHQSHILKELFIESRRHKENNRLVNISKYNNHYFDRSKMHNDLYDMEEISHCPNKLATPGEWGIIEQHHIIERRELK